MFISVGRNTLTLYTMCLLFHWDVHTFSYTAKRDCSHSRNETCCSHHPVINYQCKNKTGNTRTDHNIRGRWYYLVLQMSDTNAILFNKMLSLMVHVGIKLAVIADQIFIIVIFISAMISTFNSPHAIKDIILMFIFPSSF